MASWLDLNVDMLGYSGGWGRHTPKSARYPLHCTHLHGHPLSTPGSLCSTSYSQGATVSRKAQAAVTCTSGMSSTGAECSSSMLVQHPCKSCLRECAARARAHTSRQQVAKPSTSTVRRLSVRCSQQSPGGMLYLYQIALQCNSEWLSRWVPSKTQGESWHSET